ncbi:MAG: phosphatase PAP2 family protein [Alphaproteobacteria bacterium]|nr:phosphatase PAP2 family protein [Alphaproteobacteria bacterium]
MTTPDTTTGARLQGAWRAFVGDLRHPPLGWVFGVVAITCIALGLVVDRPAVLAAKELDPGIRRFFEIATKLGDATGWLVILVVAIGICLALARQPRFQHLLERLTLHAWNCWFVILTCLVSGAIHHVLKIAIGRFRPRYLFSEDLYGLSPFNFDVARNSFPSGHTQTIVSICFALYLVYPRYAALYLILAGLVGLSRIAIVAHYPSDVIGGAYLAICTAILIKRHYLDPRTTRLLNPVESGR